MNGSYSWWIIPLSRCVLSSKWCVGSLYAPLSKLISSFSCKAIGLKGAHALEALWVWPQRTIGVVVLAQLRNRNRTGRLFKILNSTKVMLIKFISLCRSGLEVTVEPLVASELHIELKRRVQVENLTGSHHELATCVSSLALILAFRPSFRSLLT